MSKNERDTRERKRARFVRPAGRRRAPLTVPILVIAGVALLAGAAILLASRWSGSAAPAPVQVADAAGTIRLPLAAFDDGRARFYTYQHQDISIEYFVLRSMATHSEETARYAQRTVRLRDGRVEDDRPAPRGAGQA